MADDYFYADTSKRNDENSIFVFSNLDKEIFRITETGRLVLAEGATIDDASRALYNVLDEMLYKRITDQKNEIERLRFALKLCVEAIGEWEKDPNSKDQYLPRIMFRASRIARSALQQKESE